jgi:hypothetical protein
MGQADREVPGVAQETVRCSDCKEEKSVSLFYLKAGGKKPGFHSVCKPCQNERSKRWARDNADQRKAYQKAYRRKRRDIIRSSEDAILRERESEGERRRRYRAGLKSRAQAGDDRAIAQMQKTLAKARVFMRSSWLRRRYGLTADQHAAILAAQGSRCACCGSLSPRHKMGWHTDHDHETGTVRGILCNYCNVTIGAMGDAADSIRERSAMFLHYLATVPERMAAAGLPVPAPTPRAFRPSFVTTF